MAQGIIQVSPIGLEDRIDLTIDPALIDLDKLKETLLLPDRYAVEQVRRGGHYFKGHGYIEVIVSSPDIPEVETLPSVTPIYTSESSKDFKTRTVFLSDILVNGVSAIKEEDKERKATIEIKEIKEEKSVAFQMRIEANTIEMLGSMVVRDLKTHNVWMAGEHIKGLREALGNAERLVFDAINGETQR